MMSTGFRAIILVDAHFRGQGVFWKAGRVAGSCTLLWIEGKVAIDVEVEMCDECK